MQGEMYRHPVHRVELIMGQYLLIVIEPLCQLVLSPVANLPPCLRCNFFTSDKEADGFEREHLAWGGLFGAIHCDSLFCCVVTDTVKLCLLTALIEGHIVVLMCFNVQVVSHESKTSAVDEDVLEDVRVTATRRNPVRWKVSDPVESS
jgi:hypothetical protein